MGIELNFDLGGVPLKTDNLDLSLDPNIVRLVRLLARQAAEEDFAKALKEKRH